MGQSKITDIIVSRLQSLKLLKEETTPIGHSSSIGQVRENRLKALLKSYLPNDIGIETGFICDCVGGISPQIDIIITDVDPIPVLNFDDIFKLIPVEKVICCIEVKSTLSGEDLNQIAKQEKSINSMPRCLGIPIEGAKSMPPVLFASFALDCKISEEPIREFLRSCHAIRQVSVVGQFACRNSDWEKFNIEYCEGSNSFIETRKSIAWLLYMINDVQKNRKMNFPYSSRRTSWEAYLGTYEFNSQISKR
jgi:hypothetical protein